MEQRIYLTATRNF